MAGTYIEVKIIQYMKKTNRMVPSQFFFSWNFCVARIVPILEGFDFLTELKMVNYSGA